MLGIFFLEILSTYFVLLFKLKKKTFVDIVIQIDFRSGLGGESSGTIHTVPTVLLATKNNQTTNVNLPEITEIKESILSSDFFLLTIIYVKAKS
jgi:hypothetical protein